MSDPIEAPAAEVVDEILGKTDAPEWLVGALMHAYVTGRRDGERSVPFATGSIDIRTLQATRQ
jgi:hypothetical protein